MIQIKTKAEKISKKDSNLIIKVKVFRLINNALGNTDLVQSIVCIFTRGFFMMQSFSLTMYFYYSLCKLYHIGSTHSIISLSFFK